MFTFKSPSNSGNIWTLCFRDKDELSRIYYENRTPEEGTSILGVTEYTKMIVYIDKDIDGYVLRKTLAHELTHVYLWETGQSSRVHNEEEVCELIGVMAEPIEKTTGEILLRLREGLYKQGTGGKND